MSNNEWTVTRSRQDRQKKQGSGQGALKPSVPVIPSGKFAALAADDDAEEEQAGAHNARNQHMKDRKRRAKRAKVHVFCMFLHHSQCVLTQ